MKVVHRFSDCRFGEHQENEVSGDERSSGMNVKERKVGVGGSASLGEKKNEFKEWMIKHQGILSEEFT